MFAPSNKPTKKKVGHCSSPTSTGGGARCCSLKWNHLIWLFFFLQNLQILVNISSKTQTGVLGPYYWVQLKVSYFYSFISIHHLVSPLPPKLWVKEVTLWSGHFITASSWKTNNHWHEQLRFPTHCQLMCLCCERKREFRGCRGACLTSEGSVGGQAPVHGWRSIFGDCHQSASVLLSPGRECALLATLKSSRVKKVDCHCEHIIEFVLG